MFGIQLVYDSESGTIATSGAHNIAILTPALTMAQSREGAKSSGNPRIPCVMTSSLGVGSNTSITTEGSHGKIHSASNDYSPFVVLINVFRVDYGECRAKHNTCR